MNIVTNLKQAISAIIVSIFMATPFVFGQESQTFQVRILQSVQSDPADINWDSRFDQLGISGTVLAMAVSGTDLYVGGIFTQAGSVSANNIVKWEASTFSSAEKSYSWLSA